MLKLIQRWKENDLFARRTINPFVWRHVQDHILWEYVYESMQILEGAREPSPSKAKQSKAKQSKPVHLLINDTTQKYKTGSDLGTTAAGLRPLNNIPYATQQTLIATLFTV